MLYDWVLVFVLTAGPLPNPNVEVISYHATKQECLAVKGQKKNYICLPIDRN